jgi:23S rRNA (cytosine1962-C5)-methyltransferase
MTRTTDFSSLLEQALQRRSSLLGLLEREGTNAYRLFHGIAEGIAGLTVDRYGPLVLVQTFRDPLSPDELTAIEGSLREQLRWPFELAYNHRGKAATESFDRWHQPSPSALAEVKCLEFGTEFLIRARHQGIDPWLFLDLRAGRRFLRAIAKDQSVLNLFSYTCSVGVSAAAAGAREVWNVDFSASSMEVGRRNARLNGIPTDRFKVIEQDCLPVIRQLAGLPPGGRFRQTPRFQKFEPRQFDIVFLDPPAWAKSPFGAIDVAGDYQSLFKPALLAAKPSGGRIIATNHVATVEFDTWVESLQRCAAKAGRPIRSIQRLTPEEDFPSFDGRHPLKIVVCEV